MKKRIILWDNDIGWVERLERELEKDGIVIEEAEGQDDLRQKLAGGKDGSLSDRRHGEQAEKEGFFAVILSEGQLKETLSEDWQKYLGKICVSANVPIVFVGEEADDKKELQAFLLGASDYINRTKDIRICAARIAACIKKRELKCGRGNAEGELTEDKEHRQFYAGRQKLKLTPKEYTVLSCLFAGTGEVVSREELFSAAWGEKPSNCKRVLDTVIKQLRCKLKSTHYTISAKYGMGYSLERNMSKKRILLERRLVDNSNYP